MFLWTGKMNPERPKNKTSTLCRNRLFAAAVRDVTIPGPKLPQPNYGNDSPNTDSGENQKSSYPDKRTDRYSGMECSRNKLGRSFSEPYRTDRHEINRRHDNQRSLDSNVCNRNGTVKYNHAGSHNHSAKNLTQSIYNDSAACSPSNITTSSEECKFIYEGKHNHEISGGSMLQNLSTQNTQSSAVIKNFPSKSLRSSGKTVFSHVDCDGSQNSVEYVTSANFNPVGKERHELPDYSSGYESLEDGPLCNIKYQSHQSSKNHESFNSTQLSCTLPDGYIPPPTPPNFLTSRASLWNTTASQQTSAVVEELGHQTESKSLDYVVSSCPQSVSAEKTCQTKYTFFNSTVSLEDAIPSVEEQSSKAESLITEGVPKDASDDDNEYEESFSSDTDSLSVSKEQVEAICNLLVEVREDRISTEYDHVNDIVETLTVIVKKCIKGYWLELFGSYVSGFAVGTSDINIALIPDKHMTSSHKILQEMIKPIKKEIPNCEPVYEGDQGYRNASLSFFEPKNNICCKIRILGNQDLCKTAKLLHCFGELDCRVKTLVIAVRHWAEVCEIQETENGRLHPLNYVLMMIHFLQQHDPPVLPVADVKFPKKMAALNNNVQTVGELWLEFFKYYAEAFNWKDNVVSIVSKDPVLKASKTWGQCWIAVEEPYDERVNVAKSVVSLDVSNFIRMCFLNTYKYFLSPPTSADVLDACSDQVDSSTSGVTTSDVREDPSGFYYEFYPGNFLKGLLVPVVCSTCERLGHLCDACMSDESNMLYSLPKMTSEFLHVIDQALENVYEYHGLSESDLKSRECLIENLECYLKNRLKGTRLQLIGSSGNGFGLKDSDVDICFTMEGHSAEDIDARIMVKRIKSILLKNQEFSDVMFVSTSKIPIVKFIDKRTKLRCDISIYNELAVHNTRLLHAYSLIDHRVKILGCAMKLFAKHACIDDTAQRTLSSYSYILMVLYFLQHVEPPLIPVLQELYDKSGPMPIHAIENQNVWFFEGIKNLDKVWDGKGKNQQSVGELWVGLLEFYTTKFNFHHFISISQKCSLEEPKNISSSMFFNIQDPFIKNLNLGSKMSGDMSCRTLKSLQRARVLFGTPIPSDKPPSGYPSFEEYFFNPMNLTDGRVMKNIECSVCRKLGHTENSCRRYKINAARFFNKGSLKPESRR